MEALLDHSVPADLLEKVCRKCGEQKSVDSFHRNAGSRDGLHSWCKICQNEDGRRRRMENPDLHRKSVYKYHLRTEYGMTTEDYDDMLLEQRGVCASCGLPCSKNRVLSVDHNHETGEIRGLLCHGCNTGIGFFLDDPDRLEMAAAYLRRVRD